LLSYVTIGANDLPRSERFYSAILEPLGYEKAIRPTTITYSLPDIPDRYNGPGAVYVTKPYDGGEATVGNGTMLAFRTPTDDQVLDLHAAGLAAGGADEGPRASALNTARTSMSDTCGTRSATSWRFFAQSRRVTCKRLRHRT
jgi:catechol 2,3-dioxygenase-like lactoylglutathione lyase family enzyme